MIAFSRNLLSAQANHDYSPSAAGIAMSHQGPPLLQEEEDDQDGDYDRKDEIQVLHAACCKSRVITVKE
jgi:hypothetical protein